MSEPAEFISSRLSPKAATVVARQLRSIERRFDCVTPSTVLDCAKKESSPLHKYFTWDDTEAAHKYRLVQAAWLIRAVKIRIVENGQNVVTRCMVRVSDESGDGMYVNIRAALGNQKWREELLEQARQDMRAFEQKYSVLNELSEVIAAMNKAHAA